MLLQFKCVFSKKCQNTLSSLSPDQLLLNLKCQDGNDDDDDDDDDDGDDDNDDDDDGVRQEKFRQL